MPAYAYGMLTFFKKSHLLEINSEKLINKNNMLRTCLNRKWKWPRIGNMRLVIN